MSGFGVREKGCTMIELILVGGLCFGAAKVHSFYKNLKAR
jgi:hypothetical protein